MIAGRNILRQFIGEVAIRLDVERAIGTENVGNGAAIAVDVRAIELAEEELTIITRNVVDQRVAADQIAFVRAVMVVDRDRLDLGYA